MNKFENKLLCSDIDGTLIDDKHNISDKNIKAIEYFRENGGLFSKIFYFVDRKACCFCDIFN